VSRRRRCRHIPGGDTHDPTVLRDASGRPGEKRDTYGIGIRRLSDVEEHLKRQVAYVKRSAARRATTAPRIGTFRLATTVRAMVRRPAGSLSHQLGPVPERLRL
jgi:hypothetical protein